MQADSGVLQGLSSEVVTAQWYKIMNTDGTTSRKCHFTPHNLMKNHKLLKALGPLFCQLTNTAERKGEIIVYV